MDSSPRGTMWFQSTLPRGERQQCPGKLVRAISVSIHAPAGGATCSVTRGSSQVRELPGEWFQSTLPRGERTIAAGPRHQPEWVSIHAPAGGATGFCGTRGRVITSFNPRSRGGSDRQRTTRMPIRILAFQSTLPRGERLCFKHSTQFF